MVAIDFHLKLTRQLELYLLQQANFQLPVAGYALIALLPVNADSYDDNRTLLVSAASLDALPRRAALHGLLTQLLSGLSFEEYSSIFNVEIIDSKADIVAKLSASQLYPHLTDGEFEVSIQRIGGVTNQLITVIRSRILAYLSTNESWTFELTDGSKILGEIRQIVPLEQDATVIVRTANGTHHINFADVKELRRPDQAVRFPAPSL